MLQNTLLIVGWGFTLLPVTIFLIVSWTLMWGSGRDDEMIRIIILAGLAVFFIGAIILALHYLTI